MTGTVWILAGLLGLAASGVVRAKDDPIEVRYQVVSGANKGEVHFSIIFFSPGTCDFTEYWPNGVVHLGSVGVDDGDHVIDSLAFPFRYPGEWRRDAAVPFKGGTIRHVGETTVRVGPAEIPVHAFEVRTRLQARTLFISHDYSLPVGYDSARIKVRVAPSDLQRLGAPTCRVLGQPVE